jgi:hypothetical protein
MQKWKRRVEDILVSIVMNALMIFVIAVKELQRLVEGINNVFKKTV